MGAGSLCVRVYVRVCSDGCCVYVRLPCWTGRGGVVGWVVAEDGGLDADERRGGAAGAGAGGAQ